MVGQFIVFLSCGFYTLPKNMELRTERYRKTRKDTLTQSSGFQVFTLFRGADGSYVVLCGKPQSCYLLGFLSNKNNITRIKFVVALHDEVRDRRQVRLNAVMNFGCAV